MNKDYLYNHVFDYSLYGLRDFGVYHLSVRKAAQLTAKILCLEGHLDIKLPDDSYSLEDDKLLPILEKKVSELQDLICGGIEKGTLKTEQILRSPDEKIEMDQTYLSIGELGEWLEERSIHIYGDWYEEYADNEAKVAETAIRAISIKRELLKRKSTQEDLKPEEKIAFLEKRVEELLEEKYTDRQHNHKSTPQQKPLHVKERETLLKLIIGMAVKGYGHDIKANRTTTVSDIKQDLDLLGIKLDEDTIRKWLKASADFIPQDSGNKVE